MACIHTYSAAANTPISFAGCAHRVGIHLQTAPNGCSIWSGSANSTPHPSSVDTKHRSSQLRSTSRCIRQLHKWVSKRLATPCWNIFLATRSLSQKRQEMVMKVTRNSCRQLRELKKWINNKRGVRKLLAQKPFWSLVTHSITINLAGYGIPGLNTVDFSFTNPIFAWIMCARNLAKRFDLVFRYRSATLGGERDSPRVWGSGVECGDIMRKVVLHSSPNPVPIRELPFPMFLSF